jgi:hypothetical protein
LHFGFGLCAWTHFWKPVSWSGFNCATGRFLIVRSRVMYRRQIVAGQAPPNPPPVPPTGFKMSRVCPPAVLFCEFVNIPTANEYCSGRAPMKKAD